MSSLFLAADVGNTVASLAVFRARRIVATCNLPVGQFSTPTASARRLRADLGKHRAGITAALIGSVNPPATRHVERLLKKQLGLQPLLIGRDVEVPVANRASRPAEVGADRLLNTLAAFEKTQEQTVVVDYGTCIVFDIISATGEFLGGIITPGHKLIASALASGTALLPEVPTERKPALIGRTTVSAIRSGTFFGITAAVTGILEQLAQERGTSRVIATGGQSMLFARHTPRIESIEPHLTLQGVRLTYDRAV